MACKRGVVATIQVSPGDDCNCVGIQSITWNTDYTVTITLTNGQSTTSEPLRGPEGPAPEVEFRVSGTVLQVQINGGAWADLYDFSILAWSNILSNTYPNSTTVGTGLASINSKNIPAGQLATDEDEVEVYMLFTTTTPNITIDSGKGVVIGIDGSQQGIGGRFASYSNAKYIELRARISRTGATAGKIQGSITYLTTDGDLVFYQTTPVNGISLTWANIHAVNAMADSVNTGDIVLQAFELKYGKK